ncbi:hypothetical protein LDENG_00002730, partial [Lucifuga dentata]
ILSGLPKNTISHLQLIQNSAAQVLTRTRRRAHITPILKSLHCFLSVFLLTHFIFNCPKSRTETFGDTAFSHYAPSRWNNLPEALRGAENIDIFKRRLKTHLFSLAFM